MNARTLALAAALALLAGCGAPATSPSVTPDGGAPYDVRPTLACGHLQDEVREHEFGDLGCPVPAGGLGFVCPWGWDDLAPWPTSSEVEACVEQVLAVRECGEAQIVAAACGD